MKTLNPDNERIKREYFAYLKEANRYTEQSVDGVAKALNRFETYTKFRDFMSFHFQQAVAFKRHLAERQDQGEAEQGHNVFDADRAQALLQVACG